MWWSQSSCLFLANQDFSIESHLGFEADIVQHSELVTQAREAVDAAKAAVKTQKETLVANTKEIAALNARIEKITKQNQGHELEIKKLNNDIEKVLQ